MAESRIIADTNIVSYVMKGSELGRLAAPHLANRIVGISFVTVGELYYGAEKANWGKPRRLRLEENLRNFVVLPYSNDVAKVFAEVMVERERAGRRPSWPDAWIAATAIWHGIPLITHDGDFDGITRLKLIRL